MIGGHRKIEGRSKFHPLVEIDWRNNNWLYEHYIVKRMSYGQIAKLVNRSKRAVILAARAFGIASRNSSEALQYKYDDKIVALYESGQSTSSILTQLGISLGAVIGALARNGITTRSRNDSRYLTLTADGRMPREVWANYEWLNDAYKTKSIKQIAELVGWSYGCVRAVMDKCGVCFRNSSEASKLRGGDISRHMRKRWQSDSYKTLMAEHRMHQPRVSNIQDILYSILDDLDVKYYREWNDKVNDKECLIGPHTVDCVVPLASGRSLIIECNGDYWHNLPARLGRDKAKATYISTYLADQYDFKVIWEHEFGELDRIRTLIKYWLGLADADLIAFQFSDINIRLAATADYRLLLSKYHYLANAGRGGVAYGAYLGDTLVAVCVFSPLVRQNIGDNKTTRELSRLCIHPSYQKHNFASWFISRCIALLPDEYSKIISYCDTTYNHDGAVYKASNFQLDGEVPPDYWYVSEAGWVMHKKTLYNHAKKMQIPEAQYANELGYKKVWGSKKLKFIYNR